MIEHPLLSPTQFSVGSRDDRAEAEKMDDHAIGRQRRLRLRP
jgi:hypothetical protein